MKPLNSGDEYLDIVDEHDFVIGQKLRSQLYAESAQNFRVVNAFLVNSRGQLWIPRRTASKRIFPFCLDMSCGGHVMSAESYDDALRREVLEELNLDTREITPRLLGHLSPFADGVSVFMKVYEIRQDESPKWNPKDFIEAFWLYPHEILERIRMGVPAKGDLAKLIGQFYFDPMLKSP